MQWQHSFEFESQHDLYVHMIFLRNNGWWYEDITMTASGHFLEA
jgi:hypothetical protein